MPSSFYVQLGAGAILSVIHFKNFERPLSIITTHPALIIGMAIICSFMAMTLFLAGLRKITSSEASILSTTEPLFGVLIAAMVLEEKLSMIQISGGILILIAMILLALSKEKRKQET
jgi:drug/metabolite transporter (DMT)-like permease